MENSNIPAIHWRKSRHSSGNGQCVEVADLGHAIAVRDSKNPHGQQLRFTTTAFRGLVSQITSGTVPTA